MQHTDWQKVLLRVLAGIVGLTVLIVGYQWSRNGLPWQDKGPDMVVLTRQVKSAMQTNLAADKQFADYHLTVIDVTLVKSGENKYEGFANVQPLRGDSGQVPIEVIVDGEQMIWRTEPGAFLWLAQQDLSGVGW